MFFREGYSRTRIDLSLAVLLLSLTLQAHGFTKSAVEAIEAKGGKCELLSPTTNKVVEMDEDDEE